MTYAVRVFASIRDVVPEDWNRVHLACGDAFTDPRFIEIVESTLESLTRCAPVVFYDDDGRAVAITCLSTCRLDATTLAGQRIRRLVGLVRRAWPKCLQYTLVICGLPVTVPQLKLCILPEADRAEVLRLLDEAACEFAARHRATAVMLGDFPADERPTLDGLLTRGYSRFGSAPMHILPLRYKTLPEYYAAMRSEYRRQLQADIKRFDERHVRIETVDDVEKCAGAITSEFYEFYLQLLGRVEFHLLTLPPEFLNQLVRLYHREIHLLRVFVDDRPAGFAVGLVHGTTYWFALIAVDAQLNRRFGLYPYLFMHRIGCAMTLGLQEVNLGTTADEFKLRIGTVPQRRCIYLKILGLLRRPFGLVSRFLIPDTPDFTPRRVFHQGTDNVSGKSGNKSAAK